ncbi:hypothetical protein [Alteribacter keqinensis]|uniref:Uncharacterized protein n=1 Tax=Alteribacter keqinensis TaxID=2483800 RepID=A0A3M7TPL3_9BACI|nr:hypothetical protein [Alteribacter keqinensis]RNA67576.1 hypothetical protein EBO34_12685 [Alteribacter keqinensis]
MNTHVISNVITSGSSGNIRCGVFITDQFGTIQFVQFADESLRVSQGIARGVNIYSTELGMYFNKVNESGAQIFALNPPGLPERLFHLSKIQENDESSGWIGVIYLKSDEERQEPTHSEKLVRLLSMRRAHEMLNVMTPVYGTLQMLKRNTESRNDRRLIELAEKELLKGKAHVNDFLKINNFGELKATGITVESFIRILQEKLNVQLPEAVPYVIWRFPEVEEIQLKMEPDSVCIAVFFLLKKCIDYLKGAGKICLSFEKSESDEVQLKIRHAYQTASFSDDEEMQFYTDIAKKVLQKQGGYLHKSKEELVLHLPVS